MTAFLVTQMIQHAMIKISLKIGLPKDVPASMTISKGGIFVFQHMGMVFQQAILKGHSKNRCKLVSSQS
jgi:hypothetical protein